MDLCLLPRTPTLEGSAEYCDLAAYSTRFPVRDRATGSGLWRNPALLATRSTVNRPALYPELAATGVSPHGGAACRCRDDRPNLRLCLHKGPVMPALLFCLQIGRRSQRLIGRDTSGPGKVGRQGLCQLLAVRQNSAIDLKVFHNALNVIPRFCEWNLLNPVDGVDVRHAPGNSPKKPSHQEI